MDAAERYMASEDREPSRYRQLEVIAPGIYHDADGGKFFYLTRMYSWATKTVLEIRGLNVPNFLRDLFAKIRSEMEEINFVELMD